MQRFLIIVFILYFFQPCYSQEIALTFDDAPTADGVVFTGEQRAIKIIETLERHRVKQAAFFIVTSNINSTEKLQRLKKYSDAGHLLANHSHSHNWTRVLGTANYIRDIQKADSIIKSTGLPYKRWYRYPFLDEGTTKSSRDSIRAALASFSLNNAYVTIDNYDWCINGAMEKAVIVKAKINTIELKKIYIEHVWNSIQFYDALGRQLLGRSPKHVLLLHENDIAALFLDDLIQFLKDKGWKIITPEEAYSDPIAKIVPDVLFNGQGRIGAIGFASGLDPALLVQPSEDEKYLEQLIIKRKVFE